MSQVKIPIVEIKQVYVDNLERWVTIPVYNEDMLISHMKGVDLTDMEFETYQHMISSLAGIQTTNKASTKEVYDLMIASNPYMHPKNRLEQINPIMMAFINKDKSKIEVISFEEEKDGNV